MKRLILFLILFFLTLSLNAFDEDFWYDYSGIVSIDPNAGLTSWPVLDVPGSGRYDGMAGAYTAMYGDDGFLEGNPAASSYLEETSLSFFHREWIGDSSVESVTYADRRNSLGYGGKGKFLYLPFTRFNEWGDREARAYYLESVLTGNISYNFFKSYPFSGISAGTNIKLVHRNVPPTLYRDMNVGSQSNGGLLIDVGALTTFNFLKYYPSTAKNTGLGIMMRNFKIVDQKNEYPPTEIVSGISYSPIRPWTLDFDYIIPVQTEIPTERPSFAVGQDIQFTNFFSIQTGVRTLSGNLRITLGSQVSFNEIDLSVNYILDATGGNPVDKFSTEATIKLGDRGRSDKIEIRNEYYRHGLELYSKGEISRALEYLRAAYKVDPTFTPAYESVQLLERELGLVNKMEGIQSVR